MIAIGFEISAIADGAEVAKDTVRNILSGKKNARKVTCRQIIALDPSEPIMGHRVPNVIVTRMLDEMRACGLSLQWIYRTAGINPKTGVSFTGERLSWGNYAKLRRVYDAFFDSDLVSEEGIDGSSS